MSRLAESASRWAKSLPTVAAVSQLVEQEYGSAVTRSVLVRSFTNDVYRVDADGRSYALKVYGAGRWSTDEVRWEQQLSAGGRPSFGLLEDGEDGVAFGVGVRDAVVCPGRCRFALGCCVDGLSRWMGPQVAAKQ